MYDVFKYNTFICTGCGLEVDRGIMNYLNHYDECQRNAPNENIESHWEMKRLAESNAKYQAEHQGRKNLAFPKMTDDEKNEAMILEMAGIMMYYSDGTREIYMSASSMMRLTEFWLQIFKKYHI